MPHNRPDHPSLNSKPGCIKVVDTFRAAVAEDLVGAAMEGVAVVQAATVPLLSRLAGVAEQAGQADAALRDVVARASWRLLAWMIAAETALVLGGWLATTLVLWWNTGAIAAPRVIIPPGQEAGNGNVSPDSSRCSLRLLRVSRDQGLAGTPWLGSP